MRFEAKDVGRSFVEPTEFEKFLDALFAQPLDVERAAADEMAQALELLRAADEAAGAAHVNLALFGDRLAVADGAMVGEDIGCARLVAGELLDDLLDHVRSEEPRVGKEGDHTIRSR